MTTKVITYTSGQKTVNSGKASIMLDKSENDGIEHTWCGRFENCIVNFTWKFNWETLRKQGIYRLVGQLVVSCVSNYSNPVRVDIDWTNTNQTVFAMVGNNIYSSYSGTFEYKITAYYSELSLPKKIDYDKMFAASDKTDAVLLVQGKKLNVNKSFLSLHSDYFSTLFSSNFKEGQMKEIEIKKVSYEDFGLLLSSFCPNPQFPNDHTVEKLLEMARRFQVLSVIGIVEYHLLNNSRIGYEKMLWLGDEYGMPQLLKKCISQMTSLEMAKQLKMSPEFVKLSDRTTSLLFRRLLEEI